MEQGYRLWESDTAAQGGLLHRQIRVQILDDRSDPALSARLYEKMIVEERLDLVVSPYGSDITDVMANVTERHGYPLVAAGALAPEIWEKGRKYVVGLPKTARHFLEGAIDLAANRGYTRLAIVGEDSIFTTSNARGAAELARRRGLSVVTYDLYPKGATDFTALLTKLKDHRADVLLAYSFLSDSISITRQLKAL
jgi:branched-chain amino acid transport system substrate-binding protein